MFGLCLFCQSKEHNARNCQKASFKRGSCCFTCGLPQKAHGKDIHGKVMTGECEEGLLYVVRGGCWALYRSEKWLKRWLESQGHGWKDEREFEDWFVKLEEEGEMINGVRALLEAWRDKNKGV